MYTLAETREANNNFLAAVSDARTVKAAADDGGKFIRYRQRERGFVRKFLPPTELQDSDIAQSEWTDLPRVIGDIEVDCPAAISIGYGGQPSEVFISPRKYVLTGTTILSPKISILKQQLRTYRYDVRKVWADNIVKDTHVEEDIQGISAINALLLGAESNMHETGVPQWRTIGGGISRASIIEGQKTLIKTPNAIQASSALCTIPTLMDFMKWGRDESGGDIAESQLKNGWISEKIFGLQYAATNKRFLVPDGSVYYFGPTNTLGDSRLFEPGTMYIEQKYNRYSFFYTYDIGTVWMSWAVGRADF